MHRYTRYNESLYSEKPVITNLSLSNSGQKTGYYEFFFDFYRISRSRIIFEPIRQNWIIQGVLGVFAALSCRKEEKAAKTPCILEFFIISSNFQNSILQGVFPAFSPRKEQKVGKPPCIIEFRTIGSNVFQVYYEKFDYTGCFGGFCCFIV